MESYWKQLEEKARFKELSIEEQLDELENKSNKTNDIIGEIYIKSLMLEDSSKEKNTEILSALLNNAECIKFRGYMGMGDCEFRWLFEKNNLLIALSGISYRGGPILVGGNYKVYRFDDGELSERDYETLEQKLY